MSPLGGDSLGLHFSFQRCGSPESSDCQKKKCVLAKKADKLPEKNKQANNQVTAVCTLFLSFSNQGFGMSEYENEDDKCEPVL